MATIILDFDGTIADSFDYVIAFFEKRTQPHRILSLKDKQQMRGMTMYQIARQLGTPNWKMPILFLIARRKMSKAIYNVPIFAGMAKVIEQLHAEGHELLIVSSNNPRNVKKSLKQHHLNKFFTDTYCNAGFFGKRRAIRKILARNNLEVNGAFYVGDETRDIIAAKSAAVKIIAVTWGFGDTKILADMRPDGLAEVPADIIQILEDL